MKMTLGKSMRIYYLEKLYIKYVSCMAISVVSRWMTQNLRMQYTLTLAQLPNYYQQQHVAG